MPRAKQQTLLEAPVDRVWELLANPASYDQWAAEVLEVTGAPTKVEKGTTFDMKSHGRLGTSVTTFEVAELDELRQIKLKCQTSGYYSHWILTDARGDTFVDVEIGVEPIGIAGRALQLVETKGSFKRITDASLDGLRRMLRHS